MKMLLPLFVFVVSLVTISFSNKKLKKVNATGQNGFALVELFTSEGCSSCPPADALVRELQKNYADKNLLVLAYHVDYWDRLGWKDPFSAVAHTARQQYYGNLFRLNSIYTPQVVVNGKTQLVGSDRIKLQSAIKEALTSENSGQIQLKVSLKEENRILVQYETEKNLAEDEEIFLLLVQKMASTDIKRGENKGRTLHHINIVRNFLIINPNDQQKTAYLGLPAGLSKENSFVAAFLQDKKTGKVSTFTTTQIYEPNIPG